MSIWDTFRANEPRKLQVAGTVLLLLGFITFLPGFFILSVLLVVTVSGTIRMWGEPLTVAVQGIAAAISLGVGTVLVRKGAALRLDSRKMRAIDGRRLLTDDQRPPVVYFRSFARDETIAARREASGAAVQGGAIGGLLVGLVNALVGTAPGAHVTLEEELARAFRAMGPFVAVGTPGEQLPVLGAARIYLDDAEWQHGVSNLMSRALLLVFRIGSTRGLWWEVDRAIALVPSERIVFWCPQEAASDSARKQYETFAKVLQPKITCTLPSWRRGSMFLWFDPHWESAHLTKPAGLPHRSRQL
jgi:hypothetical protein